MAPVFSYFRSHHRRTGSTPSSPQSAQWAEFQHPDSPSSLRSPTFPHASSISSPSTDSPVSPLPPVLPPIPRIASHRQPRHPSPPPERPATTHSRYDSAPSISYSSPDPPLLPPIARVSSIHDPQTPQQDKSDHHVLNFDTPRQEPPAGMQKRQSTADTTFAPTGNSIIGSNEPPPELYYPKTPSNPPRYAVTPPPSGLSRTTDPSRMYDSLQQTSSPSSSFSSFQRTASSTNLAVEASPASSSRSAHAPAQGPASGTTQNPRSTKARLNLLNPMSLLMKRRTSQVGENTPDPPMIPSRSFDLPAMKLPEDYDPRIKGKGVHNFDDAAKVKRNLSASDMTGVAASAEEQARGNGRRRKSAVATADYLSAAPGLEKEHAPVFVENFEDDNVTSGPSGAHRESLANQNFLARMSRQMDFDASDFTAPSITRDAAPDVPQPAVQEQTNPQHQRDTSLDRDTPTPNARTSKNTDISSFRISSSDQSTVRSSIETGATSPPQTPPRDLSRQSVTLDAAFQPGMSLKHLGSTASHNSRFSFQLNSDSSIDQEKALEDKHKQKATSQAEKHLSVADSRFEELAEEDIDYDAMDDDDYEEDIPQVGGADYDDFGMQPSVSVSNSRLSMLYPPRVDTTASGASSTSHYTRSPEDDLPSQDLPQAQPMAPITPPATVRERNQSERTATKASATSDDMYFDDGMIGEEAVDGEDGAFDETVFDSPVKINFDSTTDESRREGQASAMTAQWRRSELEPGETGSDDTRPLYQSPELPKSAAFPKSVQPSKSMNAYHSALASAAARAAKDGKFQRQTSINTTSSNYSDNADIADSTADEISPIGDDDLPGSKQSFDEVYDDDDEDDPMVAEANAEVLASEDSDFYGQEFGFYGRPASSEGEAYNGGYFGSPDMLGAALAGRNISREPNLTPITERSEYSTRNSIVNMSQWGPPGSSNPWGQSSPSSFGQGITGPRDSTVASPGLKDIAASMAVNEDDMTLGQLLRLRRQTFGSNGGNSNSPGAASGYDSSPSHSSPSSLTNNSPFALRNGSSLHVGGPFGHYDDGRRRSSQLDLAEVPEVDDGSIGNDSSDNLDSPVSPTVTFETARAIPMATPKKMRHGSAEARAQEYIDEVQASRASSASTEPGTATQSPTPKRSNQTQSASTPQHPPRPWDAAPSAARASTPPIITTPTGPRSSTSQAPVSAPPRTSDPIAIVSPLAIPSPPLPPPPSAMMQKFAARPGPDPYRRPGDATARPSPVQQQQQQQQQQKGATSVAYVRDTDGEGREKWFLERRRRQSSGELVVVGRELVEGGI